VGGLVGSVDINTEVGGLLGSELGQLDSELGNVQAGDFFVELLGQEVNAEGVLVGLSPEGDLGQGLVGERAGHDERRVSTSASQVNQATGGEQDDGAAVSQEVAVDLRLNVDNLGGVGVEPSDLDFAIKVTNVADNSVVRESQQVFAANNVLATSGGDDDVGNRGDFFHSGDLVSFHGGLQSVDGVDFGNNDTSSHSAEGRGASLTDISVSSDNGDLTGNHDVSSTLDTVKEGLAATIQVIELQKRG